jgi:hypothetical protein
MRLSKVALSVLRSSRRRKVISSLNAVLLPFLFPVSMSPFTLIISGLVLCHSELVSGLAEYLRFYTSRSFLDLSKKINAGQLNPDMLVRKYIPNLVARPFEVSREYAQLIYDQTSSPRLNKVLQKWDQENWAGAIVFVPLVLIFHPLA